MSRGTETYGDRLASCAAMDTFFLRRAKEEVAGMFPPSEEVRFCDVWGDGVGVGLDRRGLTLVWAVGRRGAALMSS